MTCRRRANADALAIALDHPQGSNPATDHLVRLADDLRPSVQIDENAREAHKRRMFRAARAAAQASAAMSPTAGSLDRDLLDLHTATVAIPGGRVLIADLEPIGDDRAREIAIKAMTAAREITEQ